MKDIRGLGVALVTPFKPDLSIDKDALINVVNYCIDGGVDYLVALGTTAETATLSEGEQQEVLNIIIGANKQRVPLVIGMGGNNTAALAAKLSKADLRNFCAVLSVSPYYNKPSQEGIYQHYSVLAKASPKPLIIYNVPSRTGSNVEPQTVLRLVVEENIIGVKEASGDLEQIRFLIQEAPEGFTVLSGDDFTACDTILHGGHGVISVLGQGFPSAFKNLVQRASEKDEEGARIVEKQLKKGMELIFQEGNPAGIKAVLASRGLCKDVVRLPLVAATEDLKLEIEQYLAHLG